MSRVPPRGGRPRAPHALLAAFALWVSGLAAGCAQETSFVQVQEQPSHALVLRRVAVVPFRASNRPGGVVPSDAASLVSGYVADALAGRGLDVVPATDVAQAFGGDLPADAPDLASALAQRFGVDAIVVGSVYRFRNRSGEALGSIQPASVGFVVRILSAPGAKVLWSGTFDQTQVALGENLLKAPRYPGGGTRWLTAPEFARWGAQQVAAQVPLAAASE